MWTRITWAAIVLPVLLGACGRSDDPKPSPNPTPSSSIIRITLPAGSPLSAQNPRGTPIVDLAPLKQHADGGGLVAAGRFEPSGLAIPEGLDVTWPLTTPMTAGAKLWIVQLDPSAGRWLATREQATVDSDGKSATGKVHHFSDIGVSTTLPQQEEEERPAPHGFPRGVTLVHADGHKVKTIDPAKLAATEAVYRKWVDGKGVGNGPMPLAAMQEIYRTGDFDTVKTLIENKVISPEHSTDMADHRVLMILQTWEAIVNDSGGKQRMHRSDSGNQKAGMSSDVDQTVYVEEFKDGRWVRAEDADGRMVELFKNKFEQMHNLKIEALDIATIAGRDKYPDWRVVEVQVDAEGKRRFRVHAAETMFTLRRTPGAYTYCGAVVQQMQLRVLDTMEKQLRAGAEAQAVEEPRPIRIKELKEHNPDFRLNHLLFNTIETDPKTGNARAKEAFREDATRVMFDGLPPKLVAGHSYDAAVANYFEFLHYLHDKNPAVKYHLRALDDGFQMLERLRKGTLKTEYSSLPREQRPEHMKRIFGESLSNAPPDLNGRTLLDRWQTAFDISADLRELHSKKQLTDETAERAFQPLAEEIAGDDKANWKNHLPAARAEYNRRCQEFMVYTICETSQHRVGEFLAPDPDAPEKRAFLEKVIDEGTLRRQLKLEGKHNDAHWSSIRDEFLRNYSEQARVQLLYSFRQLNATRPDIVEFILKQAEKSGRTPEQMALLRQIDGESRSIFFGLREFGKFPKTYARYAQLAAHAKVSQLGHSIMTHLAGEYGFIETPNGRKPTALLQKLGMTGMHANVTALMKQNKLVGITDRFLGNTFLNIGAVQSGANVLRAYSLSGGDPAELNYTLAHEFVLMLPGIGQVVASYEAGSDWRAQLMIIVPLLVPEVGILMAVYGIGDAGLALYDSEYVAPLGNDIADALYRGYVGPAQYEFTVESHPPEFTEEDEKKQEKARGEVKRFSARVQLADPEKGDAQALAIAGRDERVLSAKQSAWKAYLAEQHRYEGSAIFGTGRHMDQKVLELPAPTQEGFKDEPAGTLLANIKPVIFYSRNFNQGPVDFTTKPLTEAEKSRLEKLDRELKADQPIDPRQWVDLETEWAALSKRKDAAERAQRYLESAKTKPELMLQIRLDSLWHNLKDNEGVTEEDWARKYVGQWVAIRKEVFPDALKKVKIEITDTIRPYSDAVLNALSERLRQDLDRSRRLWLIHQITEEARAKWEKEQVERKKGALMAEQLANAAVQPPMTLSESVQQILVQAGADPREAASLTTLAEAYMQRNIPESAPSVQLSVRRVPAPDKETQSPYEFRPDVKVSANPAIYVPPYSAFTYSLDPKAAQEAVSAQSYRGLPLSDDMVKGLAEYLKGVDPAKDKFNAAVLTFVFCADVRIPARNVPETVEHLPRLQAYDIPIPEGMEPPPKEALELRGYLFGGGAFSPPAEQAPAVTPATGGLRIFTRRADVMYHLTSVVVDTDILATLDSAKPDQGLCLRVERAADPAGAWEAVQPPGYYFDKPTYAPGVTPAEMSFTDDIGAGLYKGTLKYQSYHYRVTLQTVTRPDRGVTADKYKFVGSPVTSNVAGPEKSFVRMSMRRPPEEEGKDKLADGMSRHWVDTGVDNNMYIASGGLVPFGCNHILPNQYYDFPETHYVVTYGSFTGHYFDPPAEFYVKPANMSGWNEKPSIRIPFVPRNGTLTITATAKGASATRTLNVIVDPKLIEKVAKQDEQYKQAKDYGPERKKIIADTEAGIKRLEDDLAKHARQIDKAAGAMNWCDTRRTLENRRHQLATYTESDWPQFDANQRSSIANNLGDYAACLESAKLLLTLNERGHKRSVEHLNALIEINGKKLAYAGQFKFPTKDIDAEAKALGENLEQEQKNYRNGKAGAHHPIKNAALLAGDGAAYKAALDQIMRLETERGKPELAAEYAIKGAEEYVMLTGDRESAARLFNEGWDVRISKLQGQAAEDSRKYRAAHKPSWLPASR